MHRIDQSQLSHLLIYELKLFAPARVNGQETLAYLDTAATHVTISPSMATGLPRTGKVRIRSAFGEEEFEMVSTEIAFLDNPSRSVEARVHEVANRLPIRSGLTLDGPTLFTQPLIFDFRVLGLMASVGTPTGHWRETPADFMEHGLCRLQMEAANQPVWALFDTGTGLSLINSTRIRENGIRLDPAYEIEVGDASDAKAIQIVHRCSGVRLGDVELPPFDCISVDLQGIEQALDRRIDLVFGANAMLKSGFRWLFDKSANRVLIEAS